MARGNQSQRKLATVLSLVRTLHAHRFYRNPGFEDSRIGMKLKSYMNLETTRLILRYLRPDDLEDLHSFRSDPEVCRYQGYEPATLEESKSFIEWQTGKEFGAAGEWVQVGLELKGQKKLIGDIGLKPEQDVRIVEFGISMSRDFHGAGLATEALTAIFDHLFTKKDVHRITAIMDVDNAAMTALAERLGFRREGHYRQSFFDKGEWRDEYLYALLERDWPGGRAAG